MGEGDLDLVVAGTRQGVLMVESEAKELSEEIMLGAVEFGHKAFMPVIDMIISLAEEAAKDPWTLPEMDDAEKELRQKIDKLSRGHFEKAYKVQAKSERREMLDKICADVIEKVAAEDVSDTLIKDALKSIQSDVMRGMVLKTKKRIDGRDTVTVRPISCEVDVLPRSHGSALFTRGETQALSVTTLGTGENEQIVDLIEGEYKESFMLHYNFPPFSVGEAGRMGSPGRREIGHGKLAWRAIHPYCPKRKPFLIRCVRCLKF